MGRMSGMTKRILALFICVLLFILLLPAAAMAEEDYVTVTVQKGDTVRKLCEANGLDYATYKYVIMVLNGLDRERKMEVLSIGDTIKIPKAPEDIVGIPTHLISPLDKIEYYVIPYKIQKGDSLKHVYELWGLKITDYLDAIVMLNPGKDLDLLYIGDIYYLPTTEQNLMTNIYVTVMSHVLLEGERLEDVFSRYGFDFEEQRDYLQSFNITKFDDMVPGDKLLIPLTA